MLKVTAAGRPSSQQPKVCLFFYLIHSQAWSWGVVPAKGDCGRMYGKMEGFCPGRSGFCRWMGCKGQKGTSGQMFCRLGL